MKKDYSPSKPLLRGLLFLLLILTAKSVEAKPNVILIMADDFGYECLAANGGESYQTPNLDRLAADGIRFEHCHVQPLCTPTRVQLMTGLFNVRNYLNFGTLPRTETTFGNLLKQAGYATGVCGKWQLGQESDSPQHFGFDEAYLWQHTRRPPRYANPGLEENGVSIDFTNGEYGPKLVNDFALDFITRHRDHPFFLYYPMILTHDPFQPTPDSPDWNPKAMGETVNRNVRHFAEMVSYMDSLVGQLDSKLADLSIRDNTLLLFLGDNGTSPTVTSRFRGAEYQGGKGVTTSRGTRVPMIASWPSVIKKGTVCSDLISSVDFLPTICEASQTPIPSKVDGISFLPQIEGKTGTPREWIYAWYSPRQKPDLSAKEFAFNHKYKLYRSGELFDIEKDLDESHPIPAKEMTGQLASEAAKLRKVLDQFANVRPSELDQSFKTPKANKTGKEKARQ